MTFVLQSGTYSDEWRLQQLHRFDDTDFFGCHRQWFPVKLHSNFRTCDIWHSVLCTWSNHTSRFTWKYYINCCVFIIPSATKIPRPILYRLTVATSIRTMLQASRVFKERRSEKQTNMTLIAVALSFLLLRPPYIISYCIYFRGVLWKNGPCDPLFDFRSFAASGITYIFAVLNYSLNFVLYFVSGSSFRKEFYFTIKRRSLKVTSPSPTAIRRLSRRRSLSDSAIHSSIQVPQHVRRFHSATTAINFSKWTDSATCSSANYHLAYSLERFVQVDILSVCVGYIMVNENTYMCICITICVV